ncbi:peptidoglycan DD-metalloendopeptidase family protein [Catellatospora methionotrophica]|uniref:peptidoglycan DD-metalloendopeptidase family protein n=1 Tax=Catellatospora methionotrophica TaxID=121620 RepID=UPI0033C0176B
MLLVQGPSAYAATPSAAKPVAITASPSGLGYLITASDGGVFAFGDAQFRGSMGGQPLNAPVVGMARTPDGGGYWLVASDGGIFAFGNAGFHGSMGGRPLNKPVVGIAGTPDGGGYWLVASDGGIFAFGNAGFHGSMGGQPLNKPVVGIAGTPDGGGYWLVASDGGIFAFGNAGFYGSTGGQQLNGPIIGIARTGSGLGYRLSGADGGVFAYGDAQFFGSMVGEPIAAPIVGITTNPTGGYWILGGDGGVFAFGNARYHGRVVYSAANPGGGSVPVSRNYALVLPRPSVTAAKLNAKHHDYPAVDIPVPVGTAFYAITSGTVTNFDQASGCGYGVQLAADDGGVYVYCHASQRNIASGSRVGAGAQLGKSGGQAGAPGAGSSTGPHLHLQLKYPSATRRCPQSLLVAIYNGTSVPALSSLPTSGCSY